jgi:hypothetical protein
MNKALIGFSGFVGGTLLKQTSFTHLYRSTNIGEIRNKSFDTVVCAGAPAQKWVANRDPEADHQKIAELISHLKSITCKHFILISTVDVFKNPVGVDEDTIVDVDGLHAYGNNRRLLEEFVENNFSNSLIVRLPGLVGPGLKKNVIFDFLHDNNVHSVDSRGIFQFYPMVNLWPDIEIAMGYNLKLIHLSASPISVQEVSELGFGKSFVNRIADLTAIYDVQSKHAGLFGGNGRYQYSQRETVQAIRAYAQSELPVLVSKGVV